MILILIRCSILNNNVDKAFFLTLLKKLFEQHSEENAVSGFRGSGIFPPDKGVIKWRILKYVKGIDATSIAMVDDHLHSLLL